ncbi:hypothetical protein JHK87_001344 [Glycine soja]|nr:hypothetical protein JHK87_001344 [Glycine soja]
MKPPSSSYRGDQITQTQGNERFKTLPFGRNQIHFSDEKMIALKAINASFTPTSTAHTLHHHHARLPHTARASSLLCFCSKSNNNEPDDSQPPPQGNAQSQELLVQIAMLQTQKIRLTDFLDERSAYLAQFGEEAKAEFDKIGEDALKGLDEAGARLNFGNIFILPIFICIFCVSQMLEFEESIELNILEIEESENKIVEFECQMERDQNEGLFFKNLGQKAPVEKAKAKEEEVEKIKDVNSESIGSNSKLIFPK